MKHCNGIKHGFARAAMIALCLVLTAILLAVPSFAATETGSEPKTAPFYFTPLGMTVILLGVALCVLGIIAIVRAIKSKHPHTNDVEPTVIQLEPRTKTDDGLSFAQDVERFAKEEREKEAAKDKKELNRAINEILYAETLADRLESHRNAPPVEEQSSKETQAICHIPAEKADAAFVVEPETDEISGDLADRVERRTEDRVTAADVTDPSSDPLSVKRAAYETAFEEALNISADCADAVDLTEDTEDISPVEIDRLRTELEQSDQPLEISEEEVTAAVSDIRESVLAEGEEPIELVEEEIEDPTLEQDEQETANAVEEVFADAVADTAETVIEVTEEVAEEPTEPAEEDAIAAFAETTESDDDSDAAEDEDEETEGDGDEESTDAQDAPTMIGGQQVRYIDVKAHPEEYAAMLEREARGEVTLVYRYRKSFLSKMSQATDTVKSYYNDIKNAFLAFKGVKCRTSWGYEAFNIGRTKLARLDVKTKAIYLYLGIDPQSLVDTKYTFKDVSEKKKYAATPTLLKIRGERKFKHALELIEKLCGEELQCKRLEQEPVDYRLPMMSQEELIEAGYVRMMVGEVPVQPMASDAPAVAEPESESESIAIESTSTEPAEDPNAPQTEQSESIASSETTESNEQSDPLPSEKTE